MLKALIIVTFVSTTGDIKTITYQEDNCNGLARYKAAVAAVAEANPVIAGSNVICVGPDIVA